MMDPFDTLCDEHQLIRRVLVALAAYAEELADADPADLPSFVVFLTELVEVRHHAKEEGILFEAMARAHLPGLAGTLATMKREHAEARRLAGVLSSAAMRPLAWTPEDRTLVAGAAGELVKLLREHMQKEEDILFPMARHNLKPDAIDHLRERFEAREATSAARSERAALSAMAEILVRRYSSASEKVRRSAPVALN
ncbi:MAG: hemerythrin domain-containing protein [Polyangiaceae bacterium]